MNERDFQVGGKEFKLSKLDAFKQFHIVRRLGPVLGEIVPVAQKIGSMRNDGGSEEEKLSQAAEIAKPIMDGISKLSDADANFVLLGLLEAVEMKQQPAGNWARIARGGNLMIQTLELPEMLQVAGRAFSYNLSGFFSIAPQTSHGGQ